jgi:tRNA 2-thiouridine synthesizing protein A
MHELDVKRSLCPIPVIRTQNRMKELAVGEELEVIATDPGALEDIPAWCRINGHEVLETHQENGEIRIRIRAGEESVAP